MIKTIQEDIKDTLKSTDASYFKQKKIFIKNNLFVDEKKITKLKKLMYSFFNERS